MQKQITRYIGNRGDWIYEVWSKKPHYNKSQRRFQDDSGRTWSSSPFFIRRTCKETICKIVPILKMKIGECRKVRIAVED